MIVASGTSNRHVNSIAENLIHDLRAEGVKGIEPEGLETGDWVLIDIFDVVVHVMQQEARERYDLEAMWQVPVAKKREGKVSRAKAPAKAAPKAAKASVKKAPARKKASK
jgi:ribosome-associated protein